MAKNNDTTSQVKVLSKVDRVKLSTIDLLEFSDDDEQSDPICLSLGGTTRQDNNSTNLQNCANSIKPKLDNEAQTFKLIDDRDWNIVSSEPISESAFFTDGHSAMSIISVLGPKGVGKSSLLNKIAKKDAFVTYENCQSSVAATSSSSFASNSGNNNNDGGLSLHIKHVTKGIDIHSTHHRILLDCQPMLASSILEDFLCGNTNSQFPKNTLISDPITSCHMISLQLATFLIATSDYVIIMSNWLIDIHLLKLISSAIMMIGEDNLRAKFIVYSDGNEKVHDSRFRSLLDKILGLDRIDRFFDDEKELLYYIAPYTSEKCDLYEQDPKTFSGKNWLMSCQRLWNTTIKNSSMFSDYALQLSYANNINI